MCLTCFSTVNHFFPSFFSPSHSPFLAVEDNVTEDQHSPGQAAIQSGNASFHFSIGNQIVYVCAYVRVSKSCV